MASDSPSRPEGVADANDEDAVTCRHQDGADTDRGAQRAIEVRVRSRIFAPKAMAVRFGRFTVLDELGQGGMGMVYAAYDEELDRKVAVKVLREDELPNEESRLRFQREAQTQARLSHPNVVTVHEVGESDDGQMFLAMEFVRGESLDAWRRREHPWPEIVRVYLQAGRGLLAAHDAGLVHRDFKPHNAMRGEDGVVKVLDFGLARSLDEPESAPLAESEGTRLTSSGRVNSASFLTVPGIVLGTPRFMSPEQHEGAVPDARTDQYSFCVALWQGLTGEMPFGGETIEELVEAKRAGAPSWPSRAPAVPRRMVEALRRGLAVAPDDRWPSMEPLLEALTWDPGRRRQRWVLGVLGVGVLGGGGLMAQVLATAQSERCSGAEQQLVGVWDDARREEVAAVFQGLTTPFASEVWDKTSAELDAYADDWVATHTEACRATTVRGEQSAQMLDLRMSCLSRAAVDLRTTVDMLADADVDVASNAHDFVGGLRPLARCSDPQALSAAVEPPRPEDEETVAAIRESLSRVRNLRRAARFDAAATELEHAKVRLAAVDYRPVQVEVKLQQAHLLSAVGEYDESVEVSLDALEEASALRLWDAMRDATAHVMGVLGPEQRRFEEALQYRRVALGLARGRAQDEARVQDIIAATLRAQGKYDEAEAGYRLAADLYAQAYGAEHHKVAFVRSNVASVLEAKGKDAEAQAEHRAAISQMEASLGPRHPSVATLRDRLGVTLIKLEEYEEAETELRAALEMQVQALGREHSQAAATRQHLAIVLRSRGKYEEAEAEFRALIETGDEAQDAEVFYGDLARANLGSLLVRMGRHEEALVQQRIAAKRLEERLGPNHHHVLGARINLTSVLYQLERLDEVEAESRDILPRLVESMGPDHRYTTAVRSNLAVLLLDKGEFAEALPMLEEVYARRQNDGSTLEMRVEGAQNLAQALWKIEGPARDRGRAKVLNEEAWRLWREAEDSPQVLRDQLQEWLDENPLGE
ncbi:MAG: serine/threonine-protein kinase [Myxococcota bacterium]